MGSIFSLFISLTFDTELYTHVAWMFLGVVALGFGFAYISRLEKFPQSTQKIT